MYKIAVMGAYDSIFGFAALGLATFPAEGYEDGRRLLHKLAENGYDGAPLHFIGHLQRNKVKQVVGKAALIQSVGSLELLEEIEKQADKLGIVHDILL